MLNQASVVLCEGHFAIHILKLHQLDDLIKHILHDKVVIFLGNLAIVEQGQVHEIVHLELHKLRLRLNLLQNVELLPGYDIDPIHAKVDEDGNAGQGCHEVPTHRRLQHLQHLVIVSLLVQSHTA